MFAEWRCRCGATRLRPAWPKFLAPRGVVVVVDDVVVVGVGFEAFAGGAEGFSPHDVVGGVDDAVVVVVAGDSAEKAADFLRRVGGRMDVEICLAVLEGEESAFECVADCPTAGSDESGVVGGGIG